MRLMKTGNKSVVQEDMLGKRQIAVEESGIETVEKRLQQDDAVIMLWISVIDKIIVKPFAKDKNNKPFKDSAVLRKAQEYRQYLGDEAWEFLKSDESLSIFRNRENQTEQEKTEAEKHLKEVWDGKINITQKGRVKRKDFPRGRLYDDFVSVPYDKFGKHLAEDVVKEINGHLNLKARKYKIAHKNDTRKNSAGLTQDLTKGMENNTLQNAHDKVRLSVSEAAWNKYTAKAGVNIAELIKARILKEQDTESSDKLKEFPLAVEVLREQIWSKIFGDAKSYSDALRKDNESGAELLAVHNAVKEAYKRLLKGRFFFPVKLKPLVSGKPDWQEQIKKIVCEKLEQILPADNAALFRLVGHKQENQNLNALIRLGKILHYEASKLSNEYEKQGGVSDTPAAIIAHWKDAVENLPQSFYWSSAGQTQIKQSEAFVRVWRRALAFAAHNLKDLAENSENKLDARVDILTKEGKGAALSKYDTEASRHKFELLFADNSLQDKQYELVCQALNGIADLRNAAFHFKGLKPFIKALQKDECKSDDVNKLLQERYEYHLQQQQQRLKENFNTIGLPNFIGKDDANTLWHFVGGSHTSLLPLPRLRRVLERAEKAWKDGKQGKTNDGNTFAFAGKDLMPEIKLPNYVSAQDREHNEAENCQWAVLRMLYDGAFKTWLDNEKEVSHEKLQAYIDHAVDRATWAARVLNSKDDIGKQKSREELILTVAKSDRLKKLKAGDTIESFFYELTAETASEMRVQKGYDSDGKNAQQQAKYIEDLKCDVVALAFADYLNAEERKLGFVLELDKKQKSDEPHFKITQLADSEQNKDGYEAWQAQLYFLLHFIPVEEANSLRMQIRKYQIVVRKTNEKIADKDKDEKSIAKKLVRVLDLYIFMHDAQYVDNEKTGIKFEPDEKKIFYLNTSDWDRVFEKSNKTPGDTAAHRDLRELLRFGGFELLSEFFKTQHIQQITSDKVVEWERTKAKVEGKDGLQKDLQDLHDDWKEHRAEPQWLPERKGKFPKPEGAKFAEYRQVLEQVAKYRDSTAQVMLQNPLRWHRLLMTVIGRLIDFGGLWERDLYFTMLALFCKNKVEKFEEHFKDMQSDAGITTLPVNKQEEAWHKEQEKGLLGTSFLEQGLIVDAFCNLTDEAIKKELTKLLGITGKTEGETEAEKMKNLCKTDKIQWIRNRFAHLAMLERDEAKVNLPLNLTQEINYARQLMSYDRKLKNAVSKSVKDLLEREKLKITWQIKVEDGVHNLREANVEADWDFHLKKTKTSASDARVRHYSKGYVNMVEVLFKPKYIVS